MAKVVYKKYKVKETQFYKSEYTPVNYTEVVYSPLFESFEHGQKYFYLTNKVSDSQRGQTYYYGESLNLSTSSVVYVGTAIDATKATNTEMRVTGEYRIVEDRVSIAAGAYIGEVTAEEGTYPGNGEQGGYWYKWDRYLNSAPRLTGSPTEVGNVNSNFDISYSVSDSDNDDVKVQIMVDNRVIQYPMSVPLNRSQTVPIRIADYGLGSHTITVTATDSSNASATRTYNFSKTNVAPTISGSDMDLGAKYQDFTVDYIIQDADGDTVKVEIKVDGAIKQSPTTTTLGVRKYYSIPIKDVSIGRHTIEITASDSQGASSTRRYTFQKVNSAPVISGRDESLGAKNTGFSYIYTIKDNEADSVTVYEKLNGKITKVKDNITLGATQTITISDSQIKDFDINGVNTIEIEATDGTATTYRRVTFVRNNMPPIISDRDKDLGTVTNSLNYNWSATDPEKDKMTAAIYLDDRLLKARHVINEGAGQSINLEGLDMLKISKGKHTIRIVVEDDKGFTATRTITFTRDIPRLIMKLTDKGIPTDELAQRVLVSTVGIYVAKGAVVKYEVCNNSYDNNPTWEDATTMVKAGKAFNFQNKTKKATQAGIDIKVTIEKGTATMQSYISAIGGSFD